jgi:hypothetical protein
MEPRHILSNTQKGGSKFLEPCVIAPPSLRFLLAVTHKLPAIIIVSPYVPYIDISAALRMNVNTGAIVGIVFGRQSREIAFLIQAATLSQG